MGANYSKSNCATDDTGKETVKHESCENNLLREQLEEMGFKVHEEFDDSSSLKASGTADLIKSLKTYMREWLVINHDDIAISWTQKELGD